MNTIACGLCGKKTKLVRTECCGQWICDDEAELFVWYGTNDYNFTKLQDPPAFESAHCCGCGAVISLAMDGFSQGPEGLLCDPCTDKRSKRPKGLGLVKQ